jgi:hypothetical protein
MVTYRLKKEYPESPKLGTIVSIDGDKLIYDKNVSGFIPLSIGKYTEFWEEVSRKTDFEILSYYYRVANSDDLMIYDRSSSISFYRREFPLSTYCLESELKGKAAIYSVLRIFDGVIFTVGDKIEYDPSKYCTGEESRIKTEVIKDLKLSEIGTTHIVASNLHFSFDLQYCKKHKSGIKEYEILSFKHKYGSVYSKKYSKDKLKFCQTLEGTEFSEEEMLKDTTMTINSVKRLSDGEVFQVGEIFYNQWNTKSEIKDFRIILNFIDIQFYKDGQNFGITLKDIKKLSLLLITEDGVDVYAGDTIYYLHKEHLGTVSEMKPGETYDRRVKERLVYFAKKENAEKYRIENKPCLSLNDIIETKQINGCFGDALVEALRKVVEKKCER